MDWGNVYENDSLMVSDEENDQFGNPVMEDGYCKRFPPEIVGELYAETRRLPIYEKRFTHLVTDGMIRCMTKYPIVDIFDWCGEWQPSEANA
jgi:hypothetical protein